MSNDVIVIPASPSGPTIMEHRGASQSERNDIAVQLTLHVDDSEHLPTISVLPENTRNPATGIPVPPTPGNPVPPTPGNPVPPTPGNPSLATENRLVVSPSHDGEMESEGETEQEGDVEIETNQSPTQPIDLNVRSASIAQTPRLPNLAQEALQRLAAATRTVDESPDDFRPLKKRRIQEVQRGEVSEEEEDKESQMCSICFEPWSNSGGHRIASLKCGHLFGLNCIDKWLKGQGQGKCPQCNAKSKRTDIRVIYAKAISVVDTTDRDRALKDLEAEKALRISAQKAEAQSILQHQLAKAECERMKQELRTLKQQLECYMTSAGASESARESTPVTTTSGRREGKYVFLRAISVSQTGRSRVMAHDPLTGMLVGHGPGLDWKVSSDGPRPTDGDGQAWTGRSRVMAHDPLTGMLVASKPSSNHLMPGYGLMKLSTLELRYSEYVGVHAGMVRDVSFSPRGDGMVLSAGMDKSVKLTSMHSNTVVQSYQTPVPAWACTWNRDDPNYLYCGLQNGTVHVYDVRNTDGHLLQLHRPGGGACPITSLAHVPLCRASSLNCSGLLMGTLDGSMFWEKASCSDSFTPHPLHTLPEGACTCLSFDPITRHCLASFRPSKRSPHSRHILCQLHNVPVDKPLSCRLVHQFTGGTTHKLLSRSKLFQRPGGDNEILAAFGDEGTKSVQIWDVSKTSKLQQLALETNAAVDIVPFAHADRDCLAVLTESKLFVYQWQCN